MWDVCFYYALAAYYFYAINDLNVILMNPPPLCSSLSPSSRNYTVPDPPGLFDGHVWPMYVKHKDIMENSGVDVGK